MKLYFSTGKKRLGIDTENKCFCTDYWFLGGWKTYVKISLADYNELVNECILNNYTPNWYA